MKTHTGIVITKDGEKLMKLHETFSSWVVTKNEHYNKATGCRNGAPTPRRLLLETIKPLEATQ